MARAFSFASVARADDFDDILAVDECAAPDAGCQPELDDAALDAAELAAPEDDDVVDWATGDIACPDGATLDAGRCVPDGDAIAAATRDDAGCSAGASSGAAFAIVALAAVLALRRRRALVLAVLASCALDDGSWDDAVEGGPAGGDYVEVYAAEIADDAAQLLLAHQPLASGVHQPTSMMALARTAGGVPIFHAAGPCGDRLATDDGDELLGWASRDARAGTAELVELASPSGCPVYETDADAIDARVEAGYTITARLGFVWPPGWTEPVWQQELDVAPAACHATKQSPLVLLYASPGKDESLRFLIGCPGEVVIGEKREDGPVGAMRAADAQAKGGRTAFVLDRNGDKLRRLLARDNGVERTAAYLRHKLAIGYDYIVLDEITAAPDWADGGSLNRRFRKLLLRIPPRSLIGYISIDLTQEAGGAEHMRDRRLLLRALKRRGRALALEVYLHTAEVMAGHAPGAFRRAANRVALAVRGLAETGGINRRAITTIGTSMHSLFPQYRYLDQPAHDLASVKRQVNALRHGSRRVRQQHGIGYYFVNRSDMQPVNHYSYDRLIRVLRTEALRWR